jgi:hypothetical protein
MMFALERTVWRVPVPQRLQALPDTGFVLRTPQWRWEAPRRGPQNEARDVDVVQTHFRKREHGAPATPEAKVRLQPLMARK